MGVAVVVVASVVVGATVSEVLGRVGMVIVGNVVDDAVVVVTSVVAEDEVDELEPDVEPELEDVEVDVLAIAREVATGRENSTCSRLTADASGSSTSVVDGRVVVCSGAVDEGKTSVCTSAGGGRSRATASTARAASTAIGTTLFTASLPDRPTWRTYPA